ncbi:MAG: NADPH-dependent FMN reductase [Verrucomicrobiia bacterium]
MIAVISGTNRQGSRTFQVASAAAVKLRELGREVDLIDLRTLPPALFHPNAYAEKPAEFAPFQKSILEAAGILFVVPEYNGSFPGILKYFIDMLEFPASFYKASIAFIGLGGRFGAARAIDQLAGIVQYRNANVFGSNLLMQDAMKLHIHDTQVGEPYQERFEKLLMDFCRFVDALRDPAKKPY